jgi:hypothetical protein
MTDVWPAMRFCVQILEFLIKECALNQESVFMDIGSGLGKPCLHASLVPGVHRAVGIEIEQLRHQVTTACTHPNH